MQVANHPSFKADLGTNLTRILNETHDVTAPRVAKALAELRSVLPGSVVDVLQKEGGGEILQLNGVTTRNQPALKNNCTGFFSHIAELLQKESEGKTAYFKGIPLDGWMKGSK